MKKPSFVFPFIITVSFFINVAFSKEVDLEWLKRQPIEKWPTSLETFYESSLFSVYLSKTGTLSDECTGKLLPKQAYINTLEHFLYETIPNLEAGFTRISNMHVKYKKTLPGSIPFKIHLELATDISCSGNGTTTIDTNEGVPLQNKRQLLLGLNALTDDFHSFDDLVFHEAGHFLTSLLVNKTSAGGVPLEETIADAFSIWIRKSGPQVLDGFFDAVFKEWERQFQLAEPGSLRWMRLSHEIESSNPPYVRDFRKKFKFDRFFDYPESHFTSSIVHHAFYSFGGIQNYHQTIEGLLWTIAEYSESLTSNRIDQLIRKIPQSNVSVLQELGWHQKFKILPATQTFEVEETTDQLRVSFSQSTLSVPGVELSKPKAIRIVPYDLILNNQPIYASFDAGFENELILRKVRACEDFYAALPCFCANKADVLSLKYYFNSASGYSETSNIQLPVTFNNSCFELDI